MANLLLIPSVNNPPFIENISKLSSKNHEPERIQFQKVFAKQHIAVFGAWQQNFQTIVVERGAA